MQNVVYKGKCGYQLKFYFVLEMLEGAIETRNCELFAIIGSNCICRHMFPILGRKYNKMRKIVAFPWHSLRKSILYTQTHPYISIISIL